jgi:hypothetical protein
MRISASKRSSTAIKVGAATAGAGAILAGGHLAEAAVWPPVKADTDIVLNMSTKTTLIGTLNVQGGNSYDNVWTQAAPFTSQGHLGVSSKVTQASASSSTLYGKGFVRCRNVANPALFSAAYVPGVGELNVTQYQYCSQLPGGAAAWTRVGWGTTVISSADPDLPIVFNRTICAGTGGGIHPSTRVASDYLSFYPEWTTFPVAIASPQCPGSVNPCLTCNWGA